MQGNYIDGIWRESIDILGRTWTLRVTPLPIRLNGEPCSSLVDCDRLDLLVSSAHGPGQLASAVAEAVATAARNTNVEEVSHAA